MGRNKPNMSVARIKQYTAAKIGAAERHNERKNETYGNVNVTPERILMNVHYKDPGEESYMDILRRLEADGIVSTRGLRMDAKLFDELTLDVNTYYFEENGGYEFAVKFYEEAFHFAERVYGKENIISAVMHADEINKAATAEFGYPVYHYHLHVIALPVVKKEIRWSKRCKDPALVGTVKEVIHQISHSKKWASTEPMLDEEGNPILRKNGKPRYFPSYTILQDGFYHHMVEHGFTDFQRGERGSTAEHLDSLQYQIQQDELRLAEIEERVRAEEANYQAVHETHLTFEEIDSMGKRSLTGKIHMPEEDYTKLTDLAKEGISSRRKIRGLEERADFYERLSNQRQGEINRLQKAYDALVMKCEPFLYALEHFPDLVKDFIERVKARMKEKEMQNRQAREAKKHKVMGRGWDR